MVTSAAGGAAAGEGTFDVAFSTKPPLACCGVFAVVPIGRSLLSHGCPCSGSASQVCLTLWHPPRDVNRLHWVGTFERQHKGIIVVIVIGVFCGIFFDTGSG